MAIGRKEVYTMQELISYLSQIVSIYNDYSKGKISKFELLYKLYLFSHNFNKLVKALFTFYK